MCIPVAFLISFGIPGIPGELILFAGPLAATLDIPPEVMPMFLALYLGLQLGLPDSFRTGAKHYQQLRVRHPAQQDIRGEIPG